MVVHIKREWLHALRGKKYKQGKRFLRHGDVYDPLGVLTNMYIKSRGMQWDQGIAEDETPAQWYTLYDHTVSLPEVIIKWAGLNKKILQKIAIMNDLQNKSFDEIADYIEVYT
jgi:hypothetical protein